MSDGDDCHSLEVGRREEATHDVGVEVADPAGAEVAFGSSEAQMLGCDSHVDVAVLLVVIAACPALAVVSCTRCRVEQRGTNRGRTPAKAVP